MKRSTTLLLPVLLVLASCGTTAQYSQQRFPDSIYLKPGEEPQVVRLYSEEDFENMAAANIARKNGRDTLVVILDDPWDLAWNYRYNYVSPWVLGGLGFSSYYWNRYYSGWYDPFFYSFSPWYSRGYYSGWYDPWYYSMYDPWYYDLWYGGYGYGWYGHRYGWYDNPYYSGGYWGGGGSYRGRDIVYTPRSNTQVSRTRERRPGSGTNLRYGTPGSAGSTSLTRNNGTRPATRSTTGSSTSSSTVRTREQGYNPSRTYSNKNNSGSSTARSSSGTTTRSSSGSNSTRSYSSGSNNTTRSSSSSSSSSNTTRSYSSGSSNSGSRSYSGGGGGGSSHSSGGGGGSRGGGSSSHSSGGRR